METLYSPRFPCQDWTCRMKHRTSEIAIAAATLLSFVLLLVVPQPQVPWWALILAALMGTLNLGVLISVRRQLRGAQRKLSPEGLERAVDRLRTAQDTAFERVEARLGAVERNLSRVHTQQLHAERSRAKADNKTHEVLETVRREIGPGFTGDLSGKLEGSAEHLRTIEARLAGVGSDTRERLDKVLLGQTSMERSRARSVTKTHELVRRNEHDIRENHRRLGSVEDDLRSLETSSKALRELLVEVSVTLDVLMYSSAPENAVVAEATDGRSLLGNSAAR